MKFSIRAKLVVLLAIVALLPLAAAVLTIAVGGRILRNESIGRSIQSMAGSEARLLATSLTHDVRKLQITLNGPIIVDALAKADRRLGLEELTRLDEAWGTIPATQPPLRTVLNNPVAAELNRVRGEDDRLAEIFVSDRYGQLLAATGRTEDFYQADEAWWTGAVNGGRPRIFIPPVNYDASTSVWSIDLCVPILRGDEFLGVAKAVVNVSRWISSPTVSAGEISASVMFVRDDGTILYRQDTVPLETRAAEWSGPIATSGKPGWRITKARDIQGYAPIQVPGRIGGFDVVAPTWSLVVFLPESEALGPVTRLSMVVLGVGLGIIVVIFLAGLLLIDRIVTRRIYRLHDATQSVARGDLTHHVELPRRRIPFHGLDEIDDLARDFNEMVDRIRHGYDELQAANKLKTDFIRVAGHELRTPVSYILAMTRLLKDSEDPQRLLYAVQSMGAKASRLEEIIQAMFKLMPGQRYSRDIRYGDVTLSELLEEVYLDVFPFVEQRNQKLIVEGADRIETLQADREKLRDVVENLVMNAIKFTPDGGAIKLRVGRQLGDHVSIAVQDQGPGIPESDMPHVFEPFFSGGDVMKHSSGRVGFEKRGIGLGLAVVKHFVELHGGSVSVSSGPNGTVFTVTIPIEPPGRPHRPDTPGT